MNIKPIAMTLSIAVAFACSAFSSPPTHETDIISAFYYDPNGDLQYSYKEVSEDFASVQSKRLQQEILEDGGEIVRTGIEDEKAVRSTLSDVDPFLGLDMWKKSIDATGSANSDLKATGKGVTIAVIDTGVSNDAGDLSGRIVDGKTFTDRKINDDELKHGTAVSIVAAGVKDGVKGQGLAYDAKIMPIQVSGEPDFDAQNIIDAILYAVNNGADIINLSLGGEYNNKDEEFAVNYAYSKGVFVVAATGNDGYGPQTPNYPAQHDKVFAIGNYDVLNKTVYHSSNKYKNDFLMPGVNLPIERWWENYKHQDIKLNNKSYVVTGTSFSAPYFSGLLALILEKKPNITYSELMTLLQDSSTRVGGGYSNSAGWGVPNVSKVFENMLPAQGKALKASKINVKYGSSITKNYSTASDTNVVLQKYDKAKWVNVSTVKTKNKKVAFSFKFTQAGTTKYRVVANTSASHRSAILDEFSVTVAAQPKIAKKMTIKNSTVKKNKKLSYKVKVNSDTKVILWKKTGSKWAKVKNFVSKKKTVTVSIPTNKVGVTSYKIEALKVGVYASETVASFKVTVKK